MGVKQKIVVLCSISLLLSMINLGCFFCVSAENTDVENIELEKTQKIIKSQASGGQTDENSYFTYAPDFSQVSGDFLDWVIEVKYNGEIFQKSVPVNINDFDEKFLKHPEYGEIINFDVDSDPEDDIEVIVGFYWSLIRNQDGEDVKSLETRFRVRQLESGQYIEDGDAEFEVRSTIHVNYGLVKKETSNNQPDPQTGWQRLISNLINKLISQIERFSPNSPLITMLQNLLDDVLGTNDEPPIEPTAEDSDYISVGTGYRSPDGVQIPLYTEKRFAFARESIFSPTIFQQITDPGSSKGTGPIEMIYGFRAFSEGQSTPSYDVDFSVGFDPAVYLKTKFIPIGGYIYYYYDTESKTNDEIGISFSSNVLKGAGEDVDLTLVFDKITDNLAKTSSWMSFDLDLIGDNEPLGGNFHYKASDQFDIDILVNSPSFNQKIEVDSLPTIADLSWDIDGTIGISGTGINVGVKGDLDLDMNSNLGKVTVYYPKTYAGDEDIVLLSIPSGLPSKNNIEAEIQANVNLNDLMSPSNYVYGKISRQSQNNIDKIEVFLPENDFITVTDEPILEVTDIPSYSSVEGKLYWSKLSGFARASRSSTGNPDPVHVHVAFDVPEYGSFVLDDTLTIRDGTIYTAFELDNDGYLELDTTSRMFGNTLSVTNSETGDYLGLDIDEISADDFKANWDIDTSGDQLKVNDIGFNGLVDTLKDLHLDLDYQGKSGALDLDWILGESGSFEIAVAQDSPLTLDFSQFAQGSETFDLDGHITLSDYLTFDMEWKLKRGESTNDPGYFKINQYTDEENIEEFDFYFTYNDNYGVDIYFENLRFYLNLEWWLRDQYPFLYYWLDYEFSMDDFEGYLLWTDLQGNTEWHEIDK